MNGIDNQKGIGKTDNIFNLETPLLFAHRGGALEVPESTSKGFKHAIENAEADVLELDVQLTEDGKFVVWHGPALDNVRLDVESNKPINRPRNRRKIYHYTWDELDGHSWVADPEVLKIPVEQRNLSNVPKEPDRCLMLLSDFLEQFQNKPLNIEMKKSFKRKINETSRRGLRDNVRVFSRILKRDPGSPRPIAVVSAYDDYIDEFRELNGERFPTGLSVQEQLMLLLFGKNMKNRALETSYSSLLSGKNIIDKVRETGGSTYVFLTGFGPLLPAIDDEIPADKEIFEILDRGVDGIMTDRPESLREIIKRWRER